MAAANQTHTDALRAGAAAHRELQDNHSALIAQKAVLETEHSALREQTAAHVAAMQQITIEHANRLTQLQTREAEVATLTAQLATHAQTLTAEAERNRVSQERLAILESDLRVSEEAINRLESEVRSRNMRVEELTRINSQMQSDIADARRWLDERDSLMQRLETEAAHSSALVDNIQRSIRSLAPGTPVRTRRCARPAYACWCVRRMATRSCTSWDARPPSGAPRTMICRSTPVSSVAIMRYCWSTASRPSSKT